MGNYLANCLPPQTQRVIADAIPDRDVLLQIVERVAAFDRQLAAKKAEKADAKATKKAIKVVHRLRKIQDPKLGFSFVGVP